MHILTIGSFAWLVADIRVNILRFKAGFATKKRRALILKLRSASLSERSRDCVKQEGDLFISNLATKKGNIFNFQALSVKT